MATGGEEDVLYNCKVVLAGKTGVGKTALLLRICENKFSATVPTTGVESGVITVAVPGGLVKSRIWDTAGQERYRAITVTYYRGTGGAMLVYDITDPSTFTGVEELIPTIRQHAGDACVFLLVGNKSDLEHIRAVPTSAGLALAEKYDMAFMETSARQGTQVNEAIEKLIAQMHKVRNEPDRGPGRTPAPAPKPDPDVVTLPPSTCGKPTAGCC